jgi:hypothetical protein
VLFGSAGCWVNAYTINLVPFHKHPKNGPSVRVQTCATRNVTSAHTPPNLASHFLLKYTHNIPPSSPFTLPICFHHKISVCSNKNDPGLFIQRKLFLQIKTLSLHVCIAFHPLLVYFITLGVTVLALPYSSNSIHQP